MIVERALAPYVVHSDDTVLRALEKITANRSRLVLCTDAHGRLDGVLTDGDFRRWAAAAADLDLQAPVLAAANRSFVAASQSAPAGEVTALFGPGIDHVPLLDERGRVVGLAVNRSDELRIGPHRVAADAPAVVVAEIGINHQGSVALARELVDHAHAAGADVVKFQLRDLDALYRQKAGASAGEDLGPQYTLDLLAKFDLPADRLVEVFDHCRDVGIAVMCTPWDPPSARRLADYGIDAFKIASADLTNHGLLRQVAGYDAPVVVSTGMATETEIRESVEVLRAAGASYALLHCQSTYPAPFKDLNLRYLARLAEIGGCPVGYSGHERGIHVPLAAVGLGARIIEKHVTTDRSLEGNDHKVSLLPDELAALVRQVREVEEALGSAAPRQVSTGEMMNRVNLAKSVVAARRIEIGETFTSADLDVRSPGRGLQPNALSRLVGRSAVRALDAGDFLYASDLTDTAPRARDFRFRRPWGLAVRYHDVAAMTADARPDFLEFHFSYKDLEIPLADALPAPLDLDFTTHSPDLFAGDFLLNLASEDDEHRERSIAELQRVVDLTRAMRPLFTRAERDPVVVASLGGFTTEAFADRSARARMYDRVASALDRIDDTGVRLCAQTLPPFPWYLGGQLFCNLFVDPEDTADFAARTGRRLCFDVSHSKLAANHLGLAFSEATDLLAPHTEHLHLVDATGVDGEGVQVGEGEIDWPLLAEQLARHAPDAGFIPEIWQGHVNDGEGFWIALDRLEQWF